MAEYRGTFQCEVLTPEGPAIHTEAVSVRLPLADGDLGVLAGRSPMMALLGAGEMVIEPKDKPPERYFVAGGFAHVRSNVVSVLAEEFCDLSELNLQQANEELTRARAMPAGSRLDRKRRQQAVASASAKVRLLRTPAAQTTGHS